MSRLISDILEAPEPHFSQTIQKWEDLSNRAGHDLRLLSEISQKRIQTVKALGLDAHDTTPREFYHALQYKAQETNDVLARHLKITDEDTPYQVAEKIVAYVESLTLPRDAWVIKNSVTKQLLKKQPPKKLLKVLGLRSIDSVLKRTSAHELLALATQIESADWLKKLHAQLKKITPTSFQASKSCIYLIDETRTDKLHNGGYKKANIVVPSFQTGTVLVVAPPKRFKLDVLAITAGVLQALYEQRLYSAYFRHISVRPDFSDRLQEVSQKGLPGKKHELRIGWKVLQRHFNRNPSNFHKLEQPQLQHEDMVMAHPFDVLIKELPVAAFWKDNRHVFMEDNGRAVSGNLIDVIVNASNQLPYDRRVNSHLQATLWEELGLRYMQSEPIELLVIQDVEYGPNIV